MTFLPFEKPAARMRADIDWRRPAVQRRDSIRSLSVTTTHALYPLKVQRKVSNDVARLAAASSLDPPKSAISAISARERSHICRDRGITRAAFPKCRRSNAN